MHKPPYFLKCEFLRVAVYFVVIWVNRSYICNCKWRLLKVYQASSSSDFPLLINFNNNTQVLPKNVRVILEHIKETKSCKQRKPHWTSSTEKPNNMFELWIFHHNASESLQHLRKQSAAENWDVNVTFISKHSDSDSEESTQHIEQSYGGLQCPFILTLSALGALLDPCVKTVKGTCSIQFFSGIKEPCLWFVGDSVHPGVPHLDKQPQSLH